MPLTQDERDHAANHLVNLVYEFYAGIENGQQILFTVQRAGKAPVAVALDLTDADARVTAQAVYESFYALALRYTPPGQIPKGKYFGDDTELIPQTKRKAKGGQKGQGSGDVLR